jgi:hypothetical protein
MEDQNWLKEQGYSDADFAETLGLSREVVQREGFNRAMLDLVHSENMAGYISEGMEEKQARHMADKKRSEAMKAAKENGLKM